MLRRWSQRFRYCYQPRWKSSFSASYDPRFFQNHPDRAKSLSYEPRPFSKMENSILSQRPKFPTFSSFAEPRSSKEISRSRGASEIDQGSKRRLSRGRSYNGGIARNVASTPKEISRSHREARQSLSGWFVDFFLFGRSRFGDFSITLGVTECSTRTWKCEPRSSLRRKTFKVKVRI